MSTTTATELGPPPGTPPPDRPPSPTPGRSRRWRIAVAAVIVVALIVAVVAVVVVRRPHHHESQSVPPLAPTSGPAQQRRLVAALGVTNALTIHATYRALGDPTKLGGSVTYEVWQRPPDGREDRNGAAAERCTEDGKGSWSCRAVTGADKSVGSVPGPLDLLVDINNHASAPSARQGVTTSTDVVGNQKVTCYQLAVSGDTYVLCAAADGTPELIANTTVRYELVTISSNVPASAFTP
jgi:hypothetical protein